MNPFTERRSGDRPRMTEPLLSPPGGPGHSSAAANAGAGSPAARHPETMAVAASVKRLLRAGDAFVTRQTRTRPYVLLGVAAGLGFLLGGQVANKGRGLPSLLHAIARLVVTQSLDGWATAGRDPAPA